MSKTATKREAGVDTSATNGNGNGHSPASTIRQIALSEISVSMLEPQVRRREHFKPAELKELADSILSMGLISPITVRPKILSDQRRTEQQYELVAGERRYLATKLAGLDTIEAVVRDLDDQQTIEIQLHENLKRLEIEPLDEAFSYKYLIDHAQILEGGLPRPYTVADIAAKFSRTEEIILRRLKLIEICEKGKTDLAEGFLPLAHAELLARFPEKTQLSLLKKDVYRYGEDRKNGANSLDRLKQAIESNNSARIISSAKFDPADATLRSDGLVCAGCSKRTGFSPKLFSDTKLGNKDTCLDSTCWDGKIRAMLQRKREKIAADLPNPKNLSLKQLAELVPLVKKGSDDYYGHRDISLGKAAYLKNDYSKKTYSEVKKGDCEFVEQALRVGGKGLGATTLVCRSKECKKHKVKGETSSRGYDYDADRLKRDEHDLNASIVQAVRIPLIERKVQQFDEARWVFDTPDGRRLLLASMLSHDGRELLDEAFVKVIPKDLLKNRYQEKDYDAIVKDLDLATVSQLIALYCFKRYGESSYQDLGNQEPVKQLAQEFGENYELLAAAARVKLTPTENGHRAAAQAHLDAIKAGKPSKPPTVFWPRVAVKPEAKKSAKKVKGGKK